jgi:hypothetical protein
MLALSFEAGVRSSDIHLRGVTSDLSALRRCPSSDTYHLRQLSDAERQYPGARVQKAV